MTDSIFAAVVQMNSQDDIAANMARACGFIIEAARAGAELVTLPENFAFFGDEEKKRAAAETIDDEHPGPIVSAIAKVAAEHRVHVIGGGMPERSSDAARPYNTSVHVGPDGRVVARYRKVHLFDVELADGTSLKESNATCAGDPKSEIVMTNVNDVKLGMTICYDVRFPEIYRAIVDRGARIVTVPAAFTVTTGKDHWHVLLRARAIENQVFVLAPAQHGKHPRGRQTYGKSVIIDPWGDVIAQSSDGEGFAMAKLDFAYQDRVRAQLPVLSHRRLT